MGNGVCTQQQPSIDEVNIKKRALQQDDIHPLPLLNSQSQSPSKPSLESQHPTIPKFDEEEFEIHLTNEDQQDEELSPIRESRLSKAQSPTKIIKSKHTFKHEEIYFLDMLKQDKTKVRRKSADRQLSPVKVVHQKKHNTAMLMEETQHNSSQLIKVKRLSYQLDEAVIMPSEPKSILKTIGSEKSITNTQRSKTNSQKKVRFGKVYRQTNI